MEQLNVPGRVIAKPVPDPELNAVLRVSVKYQLEVNPPTRAGAANIELKDLDPTDLVELVYDNNIRQWISVAQLIDDLKSLPGTRGLSDDVLVFPASFGSDTTTRGGMFDRVVRYFTVHVIDEIKDKLVSAALEPLSRAVVVPILQTIENKLEQGPGLYRFADPGRLGESVAGKLDPGGDKPVLILIHGTGSSSVGSFGDLAGTSEWNRIRALYADRIYGLEHRTLSLSPIQNAIDLLNHLPKDARVHLVTHSRGGLVGELLCIKELQTSQIADYASNSPEGSEDAKLLDQLRALLAATNPRIERFVRVACPSRGTLLASDRLDQYCSALLNLIGLLPALNANPVYYGFKAMLTSIIAMKANAEVVPGLEAQRPESPLIHLLNRPDLESAADLAVIAGNSFGGGILQNLAAYSVGIFFRRPHDFVVNTDAMYGGLARGTHGFYFDDSGDNVSHFHYFKNDKTRKQLGCWLDPDITPPGEFRNLAYRNQGFIPSSLRGDSNAPLLILVPGIFGTELARKGDRIWLDGRHLTPGFVDQLTSPDASEVKDLLPHHLDKVSETLGSSFQIAAFPYDWRLALSDNIQKLAAEIGTRLDANPRLTIHLLGMGSGGILIGGLPDELWSKVQERKGRAVLLGSPIEAAKAAGQLSKKDHRLVKLLAMVDRRSAEVIARRLAEIPGIKEVVERIPPKAGRPGLLCIGEKSADASPLVDGFISAATGNLPEQAAVLAAVKEFLVTGTTTQLFNQPLAPEPPQSEPALYPTEQDLADAALNAETLPAVEPIAINASVKHAHLVSANYPVAVGHYRGDNIVSAEKALDQLLKGHLSENFHLDLYPASEGTVEVFDDSQAQPPGALVIGLGEVGEITAEKVRRGITAATLRYALGRLRSKADGSGLTELGISSLLLGTYGGNALTVRESVAAVVDGVAQANVSLREQGRWNQVRVNRIQFIDLYQDFALDALEALQELAMRYRGRQGAPLLNAGRYLEIDRERTGRSSRPPSPYQSGWWLRLRIEQSNDTDSLQFTLLTDRARAELSESSSGRGLVDDVIKDTMASATYQESLSRILFEMLFPRAIKERLRDKVNLVLIVDAASAKYPWELLAQRIGRNREPLAKDMGILRQFVASNPPRFRSTRVRRALVIGNPPVQKPYVDLPHAASEAREIAQLFRAKGDECDDLIGEDATISRILSKVLDEEYRVIHIASHGYLRINEWDKEKQETGIVIGKNRFLTAADITKIEPVPEIVFLNCCYAGFIPPGEAYAPHEMAGSIAEQLIQNGVKAVLAAGWAVGDRAARLFSKTFYEEMLNGRNFGDAVRTARAAIFNAYPTNNTWGAYQCYGNPGFVLEVQKDSDHVPRSPQAATDAIRNITAQARGAGNAIKAALADQLEALDRTIQPEWKDGELLAELGFAYSELGRFEDANTIFDRAFIAPGARAPIVAAEQQANLQTRIAQKITDPDKRNAEVSKAEQKLKLLMQLFGETSERLALLGSLHKKEAKWAHEQNPAAEQDHLQQAILFYQKALAINADQTGYYPALNAAALQIIKGVDDQTETRKLIGYGKRSAELVQEQDMWAVFAIPDADLLTRILDGTLIAETDKQAAEYRKAIRRATERETDSVLSQIRFLRSMLKDKDLCKALEQIEQETTQAPNSRPPASTPA